MTAQSKGEEEEIGAPGDENSSNRRHDEQRLGGVVFELAFEGQTAVKRDREGRSKEEGGREKVQS